MYVCMYVCLPVCMYTYIYTHAFESSQARAAQTPRHSYAPRQSTCCNTLRPRNVTFLQRTWKWCTRARAMCHQA